MHDALVPAFKDWLDSRGLHLAGPIPTDASEKGDDLPFYIIGIGRAGDRAALPSSRARKDDDG